MQRDGYVINSVGNADSFDYDTTQIRATPKTPLAGERIRSDIHLGARSVTPVPDPRRPPVGQRRRRRRRADVTIVVGRDYAAVPGRRPRRAGQ